MSGFWFVLPICLILCQILDGSTAAIYMGKNVIHTLWQVVLSFLGVARLIGTPNLIYEWWYMSSAVIFILLVPILCSMCERIGTVASMLLLVLIPRLLGMEFLGGTHPFSFLMPVFLGVAACHEELFDRIHRFLSPFACKTCGRSVPFAFGFLGLLIAYFLYRKLPFEQFWEIKYGLVPLIVILCCNETILNIPFAQTFLHYLGKHSMNMYLLHMLFITYAKSFLFNGRHFLISFILLLGGSLILSVILEWLKKCMHWEKLSKLLITRIAG